jgi:hypothetical protein
LLMSLAGRRGSDGADMRTARRLGSAGRTTGGRPLWCYGSSMDSGPG